MSSITAQTPLPVPACHGASPLETLSEKEQVAYDNVLAHFANPDYILPGVSAEKASLIEEEQMWLSYECFLRFLRTTGYDSSKCIQRLEATLKWRREFGIYTHLTPEQVELEAMQSFMFLYGYDTQSRPIIYYYSSKEAAQDDTRLIQFFFWMLERATDFMGPGVETFAIMADLGNKTKTPSFEAMRKLIYNLQTYYPERLGVAAYIRSPQLLSAFWKFVIPLLDAPTSSKIVFDPVTDEAGLWRPGRARYLGELDGMLASSDQLVSEGFSGSVPFEYNHEVYWPALLAMCEGRRKELGQVWRKLGGVVGIKEWDVKIRVQDD